MGPLRNVGLYKWKRRSRQSQQAKIKAQGRESEPVLGAGGAACLGPRNGFGANGEEEVCPSLVPIPEHTKWSRASLPARGLPWTGRCWRTGLASYSSSVAQGLTWAITVTVITVNGVKYLLPGSVLSVAHV